MKNNQQSGFTLIEILVVIGMIALLATIVLIAINPARQFKQGRDTQRVSNVNSILNAIGQNLADNKGILTGCGPVDGTTRTISKGTGATITDLRSCIVPKYMSELPFDPSTGSNTCVDSTPGDCATSGTYDTKYTIKQDATSGRITVSAIGEINPSIAVTR